MLCAAGGWWVCKRGTESVRDSTGKTEGSLFLFLGYHHHHHYHHEIRSYSVEVAKLLSMPSPSAPLSEKNGRGKNHALLFYELSWRRFFLLSYDTLTARQASDLSKYSVTMGTPTTSCLLRCELRRCHAAATGMMARCKYTYIGKADLPQGTTRCKTRSQKTRRSQVRDD